MMEAAGTGFRIPVYRLRKQFAAFVFQCLESLLCVSARNQQLAASVAIPKYVVANYSCIVTVSPKTNGKPFNSFRRLRNAHCPLLDRVSTEQNASVNVNHMKMDFCTYCRACTIIFECETKSNGTKHFATGSSL